MDERRKSNLEKSLKRLIVIGIIAIIFVPVLYSGIYLSSFWDPYGHFDRVPVAFVNLDKRVVKDGTEYHLGQDIQDNLKDHKNIGWQFVSYDEGKSGIVGTDYYAMIVIPEDFSKKIAQSKYGKFERPTIIYEGNKGKNYVFAQVSERAAENIKAEITGDIQKETTKALAKNLYLVRESLKDASNGAGSLQNGTKTLVKGSEQLVSGLGNAATGSKQLQSGLKEAAEGQLQLSTGIHSLTAGLHRLKNRYTQNTSDLSDLASGANAVSKGIRDLTVTMETANLSQGLGATAESIAQIKEAVTQASAMLASADNPEEIALARGILEQLTADMKNQHLEENLKTAALNTSNLVANLQKLNRGAKEVAEGTNTLTDQLATSQKQAAEGVGGLISGAEKLQNGSDNLRKGLNTAVQKTSKLSSGLDQLNNGAIKLNSGLASADKGAVDLAQGLENGYKDMNKSLTFTVEGIANYIKNPLSIEDRTINQVNNYGEGLAPYFISLSLWLGAMLMNLVLSLVKFTNVINSKFLTTYAGAFISGSILVMAQAVILCAVLLKGLGMEVVNMPLFYAGNMFISVVFFSIMYGLNYAIGLVATPIVFILFILQLASSGGTFPIETSPSFFRDVSPFFPMTYTVEGLRMLTSGINSSRMLVITSILLLYLVLFYIGGYVMNRVLNRTSTTFATGD